MKFLLSSLVTLVLVGLFNFTPLHAQESKPADKPAVEEQKTDTAKTEKVDKPAVETEKAANAEEVKDKSAEPAVSPPQPGNESTPKKIDISGENPFDSGKYKTIDIDLEYKSNPAADSIFIFFNYLTMAAMVVMVVSVAIWVFKNRDKLADSGTSSPVSPMAASKKEEKSEDKTEDKVEEKSEDKVEEKSEQKSEDKVEEKSTQKKSGKSRGKSGKSKKSDA